MKCANCGKETSGTYSEGGHKWAVCEDCTSASSWWEEYDSAAEYCAKRRLKGRPGDSLPENLSEDCAREINADPEAFERRVSESAYAIAREKSEK